jgi:hypothetical protein
MFFSIGLSRSTLFITVCILFWFYVVTEIRLFLRRKIERRNETGVSFCKMPSINGSCYPVRGEKECYAGVGFTVRQYSRYL